MYNVDGPNISPSEIVNIAPWRSSNSCFFYFGTTLEALSFPKGYSTGTNYFNEEKQIPITPSNYVPARVKGCDYKFASNIQCIFYALDWI